MKTYGFFLMFVMGLVTVSCNQTSGSIQEIGDVNVDVDHLSGVSDFFDSYSYVILRTPSDSPLGTISRIDIDEEHIVACSRGDVHVYKRDGQIVSVFSHVGQGPEEYMDISDIHLVDGNINLLSCQTKKIYVYEPDGTFVESYPLADYYTAFCPTDGGFWLASETSNNSGYEFSFYDKDKKESVESCMPFDRNESFTPAQFRPFISDTADDILVVRQFDNSVYSLRKGDGIKTVWRYNFNTPMQLSDLDRDLPYAKLFEETSNKPVIKYPGIAYVSGSQVYQTLSVFFKLGYFPYVYKFDMSRQDQDGKTLRIGLESFEDFPYLRTPAVLIYDGNYVSLMESFNVLSIERSLGTTEFSSQGLTEESSQVLFFHHFKH